MSKSAAMAMMLILSSFFLSHNAVGQEAKDNGTTGSYFLRLQNWQSSATAKWRISFQGRLAGQTGTGESELTFEHLNSPLVVLSAGAVLNSVISFDYAYGFGSISGGQGTDVDRFFPSGSEGYEFSRSRSDLTGDVKLWQINVYADRKLPTGQDGTSLGLVLGVLHYEDDLIIRNGVQIIPVTAPFSRELNSTYDFSWDAFKAGIRNHTPLGNGFSFTGMFCAYPYVRYRGEGFWNLRTTGPDAFRSQSPNFVQKSTSGYGHEAAAGFSYALADTFTVSFGYRYLHLSVKNGTDALYYADGTIAESNLDWVKVTRKGAFADVLVRF